mgnify:CR=1 FL=1
MSEPRLGPYRLIRKLSQGGMGAVYEGFHEAVERHVAIKVLRPEFMSNSDFVTRFFNEAKAANRIGHPSIVQIFDCGRLTDGTSYIVMELLDGETVGMRIRRSGGRLPLLGALQVVRQVANALAAAHAKNIVHRDLKPDNIMLVRDPAVPGGERVKLLDFGIAKHALVGKAKRSSLFPSEKCGEENSTSAAFRSGSHPHVSKHTVGTTQTPWPRTHGTSRL